jgi:hypothetical protein
MRFDASKRRSPRARALRGQQFGNSLTAAGWAVG